MVMLQTFEVIPSKFNVIRMCTGGNYAEKSVTELNNYSYIVPDILTEWTEVFEEYILSFQNLVSLLLDCKR